MQISHSHSATSDRLISVGKHRDALEATQEEVRLRRQLAENRPALNNANLAISLNNLSRCLSNLGHREHALMASKEALDIC
jgi:hypothetical protein